MTRETIEKQLKERKSELLHDLHTGIRLEATVEDEPADIADWASVTLCQETSLSIAEMKWREIVEIDRALENLEKAGGCFCRQCGTEIPAARLEALPAATLCVGCQQKQEQRRAVDEGAKPRWEKLAELPKEFILQEA